MMYGHAYQHGFRANLDFKALLNGNPYNPAVHPEAHDAWEDGWHYASRARRRMHAFGIAAGAYAKTLQPAFMTSP
jgi:hypothetical protein